MTTPDPAQPGTPGPTDAVGQAEEPLAHADSADDEARERALRAGLDDYELEDADLALLDADEDALDGAEPESPLPVLAVVGRPNVGKSTLVNRILGRREAVVEDKPGVTRDRVSYPADWAGRRFTLVDTGGWEVDVAGIESKVAEQAEVAIALADAVLFVVDATVGATATDERVVRLLRESGKPVVLCANKVDGQSGEADAAYLWSLGLGEPHPVSALHGRGTGDLLDAAMAALPTESEHGEVRPTGPRRVALVGRPNVGKSSLLNKLAGADRVVVDEIAGTTRDPVDELVTIKDVPYVLVDTAGIRRRVHQTKGADFYASLRTQAAIEKAELAVVLVDASVPLTEQDTRVISQVVDAGRALVIAYNKWDLMDDDRRPYLESARSRRTSCRCSGRRASTCRPAPAGTPTVSPRRWSARSTPGTRASRRAASTRSSASSWPPTRTRCAAASSPASSSRRRPPRARRGSSSSRPGSSRRATAGSSSAACARRSGSRARPSRSASACGRSASGERGLGRASAGTSRRGRALRLGAARDTAAVRHVVTFLVVAVATVLVTRFFLAASGYPQVGGETCTSRTCCGAGSAWRSPS